MVLPPLIRSRTSSIVRSSIQTLSCMSIGRGMLVTSTRGAVLTDAVRRSGCPAGAGVWAMAVVAAAENSVTNKYV